MRDPISSVLLRQTVLANKHLLTRFKSESTSSTVRVNTRTHQSEDKDLLPMPKISQSEVDKVLQDYQDHYAPNQVRHIVSSTQGEPSNISTLSPTYPSRQQLYSSSNMKPRGTANFRVMDLTLDEIMLTLIHPTTRGFLCPESWIALSCIELSQHNRQLRKGEVALSGS
jgi:hypothetical protein